MNFLFNLDLSIVQWLNAFCISHGVLSVIVYHVAESSLYIVPLLLVVFAFTLVKTFSARIKSLFFISFASLLSLFVVTGFIASLVGRLRPFVELPEQIHPLFYVSSSSFPSGHATFFFALATALYCHNKKWGYIGFLLAAVVSVARVCAGVHYMSDIVVGAAIGMGTAYLSYRFFASYIEDSGRN